MTPGPWRASDFDDAVYDASDERAGEQVCTLEPNKERARLIAAAPELLKALRLCHRALGTSGSSQGEKERRSTEAFAAAATAIAAAEGRQ